MHYGNMYNRPFRRWKTAFTVRGKADSFTTPCKHRFPQLHNHGRLHTLPQRLLLLQIIISFPIHRENYIKTKKQRERTHWNNTNGYAPVICADKRFKINLFCRGFSGTPSQGKRYYPLFLKPIQGKKLPFFNPFRGAFSPPYCRTSDRQLNPPYNSACSHANTACIYGYTAACRFRPGRRPTPFSMPCSCS